MVVWSFIYQSPLLVYKGLLLIIANPILVRTVWLIYDEIKPEQICYPTTRGETLTELLRVTNTSPHVSLPFLLAYTPLT